MLFSYPLLLFLLATFVTALPLEKRLTETLLARTGFLHDTKWILTEPKRTKPSSLTFEGDENSITAVLYDDGTPPPPRSAPNWRPAKLPLSTLEKHGGYLLEGVWRQTSPKSQAGNYIKIEVKYGRYFVEKVPPPYDEKPDSNH
ncbi:hypothetical protein F5887DRAFT_920827 [Amanita rubescens]|nr:hypothetical protein F5887DRAFT_238788 [Amanita rubescens]KAF8336682.1 hypothetical protein F5887DRAFT_920827 [Amanita rubescens]